MNVSYGKLITAPHDLQLVTLDGIVRAIKTRPDLIKPSKIETPFYLPSGKFSENYLTGCIAHSTLMCIDIDDVSDPTLKTKILSTSLAKHIVLCAYSYTHPNFYILIKTNHTSTGPEDHAIAYTSLIQMLKDEPLFQNIRIDKVTKNINRARFLSHDPDCYYNPDALPLTINLRLPPTQNVGSNNSQPPTQNVGDDPNIYCRIAYSWATSKHGQFDPDVKGNRNAFIHHYASATNNLGVDKGIAITFIKAIHTNYEIHDFGNKTAFESAYKRVDQFGTYIINSDRPLTERLKNLINKKLAYLATIDEKKSLYLLDEINLLMDIESWMNQK